MGKILLIILLILGSIFFIFFYLVSKVKNLFFPSNQGGAKKFNTHFPRKDNSKIDEKVLYDNDGVKVFKGSAGKSKDSSQN